MVGKVKQRILHDYRFYHRRLVLDLFTRYGIDARDVGPESIDCGALSRNP